MYHNFFKQLTSLILLFFISFPISFAGEKNEINIAHYIDIAGQQPMLTHQALVSYSQIGQVQSFGNPVDLKMRAIKQFDKNLEILSQDDSLSSLNSKSQVVWNEFKAILIEVPDKKQIPLLVRLNEQLLAMTDNIIAELLKNSSPEMNIVNISGQQRMLSQRIALFMLLKTWGIEEDYKQKFVDSLSKFSRNHVILQKNEDNSIKIKRKLESVKQDYQQLISIISKKDDVQDYSLSISRLTSQILRKAKKTSQLYVKLKTENVQAGNLVDNNEAH